MEIPCTLMSVELHLLDSNPADVWIEVRERGCLRGAVEGAIAPVQKEDVGLPLKIELD